MRIGRHLRRNLKSSLILVASASCFILFLRLSENSVNSNYLQWEQKENKTSNFQNQLILKTTTPVDISKEDLDETQWYWVGNCKVFNLTTPTLSYGDYQCVNHSILPSIQICLYPDQLDSNISPEIRKTGAWEKNNLQTIIGILSQNPKLDFIDIGANLGQYSLLVAAMKRRVLAVEPYPPSVRRIHQGYKFSMPEGKIIVVQNAISDSRTIMALQTWRNSQGGAMLANASLCSVPSCLFRTNTVLMDDLVKVVKTTMPDLKHALLKIDIEAHEHRAFSESNLLLSQISVPFILMEWVGMRKILSGELGNKEDLSKVISLVKNLKSRGYDPYKVDRRSTGSRQFRVSNKTVWWPDDVLWIHDSVAPT